MTEPEFDVHPKASPAIIEQRQALAKRVCRELQRAGLPADWHTEAELKDAALDLFAQGIDYSNPPQVVRHHKTVLNQMQAALLGILTSAGFDVEEPDRHGHGSMVHVMGLRPCGGPLRQGSPQVFAR